MYVWYGTNEYNFEKLENPPAFEPTHCARCGRRINLGEDGYSISGDRYTCEECTGIEMNEKIHPRKRSS
jgi:recombinational DNA repair protein (RecF pathway)